MSTLGDIKEIIGLVIIVFLTPRLDVDIGGQNSELELGALNSTVWMV